MQKQFVYTFEEIMFELKYDVANDTKEGESGIESVRTFNKTPVSLNIFLRILQKIFFFHKNEEAN